MKKMFLLMAILILFFSFLAYAQSVPSSDLKVMLINAITDYLSSQTPKLEKNELKDLIVVYLTAKSDPVDLSITGAFSGEKLVDVYNKAKGAACTGTCKDNACSTYTNCSPLTGTCASGNCCTGSCTTKASTGKWAEQIKSATPITAYDEKMLMYIIYDIPIQQGGTYYFLADPKGVGAVHTADYLRFGVIDTDQGFTMSLTYPMVYKVDANGNELAKHLGSGAGDFDVLVYYPPFTKDDYDKGVRFLLEIIEKGQGSGTASKIYWRAF